MPARFYEQNTAARLKNKRKLSAYLDALVLQKRDNTRKTSLTYIFCDDEYLLQINQQFLDHDTYTDIITFDLSEKETELTGEIYVSIPRIIENAAKFGIAYEQELHRVIFHGALHLCGFKDKTEKQEQEMRQQEDTSLAEYFEI